MRRFLVCLFTLCTAAFSQSKFDVADVHVSPKSTSANVNMRGGLMRGGRYELHNATMVDLVRTAYGVVPDRVVGGPAWLETDRFDIVAKGPADATPDSLKEMLQAVLAERFSLVVHKDDRPLPAWALTAGKKPQLREADGTGEQGCKTATSGGGRGGGPGTAPPVLTVTCRSITMAAFAEATRTMGGASIYLNGNPVVDQTGLKGLWDFEFKMSPLRIMAPNDVENITIFDAVDKQLGLKLQLQKLPLPVIVVDGVNQKPTGNAPGVTQTLPPAKPPEFEVADVKPSDPANPGGGFGIQPGGRVNLRGMTLKTMIMQAWSLNGNDPIPGAPKWLETDRFDIIAKMASAEPAVSASVSPAGAPPAAQVDIDSIWLALRALLADRFKLTTHYEDQSVPVYALTAVKPKLTKADPANRTSCKSPGIISLLAAPAAGGATPTMALTCQNITMAQLADRLRNLSTGDIDHPVVDATGLEGTWDFVLNWSPKIVGLMTTARGNAESAARQAGGDAPGSAAAASDPGGGITMLQAMEKQLGLKLELQKRTMPVLVIDHVEQKPTEN